MGKFTMRRKGGKPPKPSEDYPLYAHATKRWAKRVRGKLEYFGPWGDPKGALKEWLRVKDHLLAGRPRPPKDQPGVFTLADLCNNFRSHKLAMLNSGELAPRTYALYKGTCDLLVATFRAGTAVESLTAADFQDYRNRISAKWGPVAVGNEIQRVRCVARYAYDAGLIDKPIRFGPGFRKPSAKVLREARAKRGLRMFERDELRTVLDVAGVNLKAMALLGINAAMGNTDLALMPIKAVDLTAGWLTYPRPKTAIPRRIPLWPETVTALKAALAERREPKDPADVALFFIGPRGQNYIGNHRGYRVDQEMRRALATAKVNRPGLSFYALRHTHQTVAEGSHDMAAVQAIMGHAPATSDMSAVYRERVDDLRLLAVTNYVRKWLFTKETE